MCHTAAAAARGTLRSTYNETHGSVGLKMRSRLDPDDRLTDLDKCGAGRYLIELHMFLNIVSTFGRL